MTLLEVLGVPVSYLVLVLIAAGARFMITKDPPTLKLLFGSIIWGLLVVTSTYQLILEFATNDDGRVSKGLITALVAIGAFFAKDILEILIKLFEQIMKDPLAILRELLNKYKPGSRNGDDS